MVWSLCVGGVQNIKPHRCPPSISLYILLLLFVVLGDASPFTAGSGGVLDRVDGRGVVNLQGVGVLSLDEVVGTVGVSVIRILRQRRYQRHC